MGQLERRRAVRGHARGHAGKDRFIVVSADPTTLVPAPFAKAGRTAGGTRVLADEGDSDYAAWLGVTAQARAARRCWPSPRMAAASSKGRSTCRSSSASACHKI